MNDLLLKRVELTGSKVLMDWAQALSPLGRLKKAIEKGNETEALSYFLDLRKEDPKAKIPTDVLEMAAEAKMNQLLIQVFQAQAYFVQTPAAPLNKAPARVVEVQSEKPQLPVSAVQIKPESAPSLPSWKIPVQPSSEKSDYNTEIVQLCNELGKTGDKILQKLLQIKTKDSSLAVHDENVQKPCSDCIECVTGKLSQILLDASSSTDDTSLSRLRSLEEKQLQLDGLQQRLAEIIRQ